MARILGIDPGERRIGIAVSDPSGTIASPYDFIDVDDGNEIGAIVDVARQVEATKTVVGLPLRMDGTEGPAADRSRALGAQLIAAGLEVEYQDERFTTVTAESALIEGGMRRAKRKNTRDQVAASVMLQGFLDRRAHDGGHTDGEGS